jgi:hypothetical protein
MLHADLHAVNKELNVKIRHITETTDVDPFYTLEFYDNHGELRLYINRQQLNQIGNQINAYLAQHTPTTTEKPTHAHAS